MFSSTLTLSRFVLASRPTIRLAFRSLRSNPSRPCDRGYCVTVDAKRFFRVGRVTATLGADDFSHSPSCQLHTLGWLRRPVRACWLQADFSIWVTVLRDVVTMYWHGLIYSVSKWRHCNPCIRCGVHRLCPGTCRLYRCRVSRLFRSVQVESRYLCCDFDVPCTVSSLPRLAPRISLTGSWIILLGYSRALWFSTLKG